MVVCTGTAHKEHCNKCAFSLIQETVIPQNPSIHASILISLVFYVEIGAVPGTEGPVGNLPNFCEISHNFPKRDSRPPLKFYEKSVLVR